MMRRREEGRVVDEEEGRVVDEEEGRGEGG